MQPKRTFLTLVTILFTIVLLTGPGTPTATSGPNSDQPDLVVDALLISPANPAPGEPICVRVTVRNQDAGHAGSFEIRVYVDPEGEPTTETPPDSLTGAFGLNSAFIFRWNWCGYEFEDPGAGHRIWAWADPLGEVVESNDDNNKAFVDLGATCTPDGYSNNVCSQATVLEVNRPGISGNLCPRGDEDWYTFPVQAGRHYTVTATGSGRHTGGLILRSWANCETGSLAPGKQQISFKAPPGMDTAWIQSKHLDVNHGLDTAYEIDVESDAQPPQDPDIAVTPKSVEVTLPKRQSKTVPLTIRNLGGETLTFSIETEQGSAGTREQGSKGAEEQGGIHLRTSAPPPKVDPALWDTLDAAPDGQTTFFVYLKEQADLSPAYAIQDWKERGEFVYDTLRETAQRSQKELLADLQRQQAGGAITDYRPFFILNAVAVTGRRSAVESLAARPDVAHLAPEPAFEIPEPIDEKETSAAPNGVEWNIAQIEADRVWSDFNVTGEGVVVANIDTGVDYTHPALTNQYRGTATGNHDFDWVDPTGRYPEAPGDNVGHGTHVMGTMVGDDGAGNQIGVAPGAQWIAAKGCAGRGCNGSELLSAAEWILAPCPIGVAPGNDACDPAQRPNVVNNSWGGAGGDTWFEAMVDAWRASDIFPAFAAGNSDPGDGTVVSPGDYAVSFASGATDDADTIC